MAEKDKLDLGEEKKPASSNKKLIFIVLGAVFGTLAAVFATLYFLGIFPPKAPAGAPEAGHEAAAGAAAEHGEHAAKEDAGDEEEEEDHGKKKKGEHGEAVVLYQELEPAFIVNFQNNPEARALQVSISLATDDQAALDAVKKHTPMIRNNLLMLMSAEEPAILKTAEGKDALRVKIRDEINAILKKQARKRDAIEEVYFTAFIMQ
jgi:flagellar FliL protein